MRQRLILLTGCSAGGKSTLLDALAQRGFATVAEPGRRIVASELAGKGTALPWVDERAFALRAVEMARADLALARQETGTVFFDRGLLDAAVGLAHAGGPLISETLGEAFPYDSPVFVAPPWKDLFAQDAERRHDFTQAVAEYNRIARALDMLGCRQHRLPKAPVIDRVDMVLALCGLS